MRAHRHSPRRRAARLAFHLRNARVELEALERFHRTPEQDVELAGMRRALALADDRSTRVLDQYPVADQKVV